ncbi:c-type cytochrome domain-containing protein [Frigoriglobus tundricola]|uniref:Cytochrome c domain-containing protein n=1 Tax=Frigoriglobus tundricola TaxID=2774151 RepID=A0A6M5YJF5_9BACT|nr:c-type cytochrome domain-containing protein [Frigoriglobus tundricola]QJW93403.1 hypothetical protein FTUN_0909 [Frigoriglobus tundricola]
MRIAYLLLASGLMSLPVSGLRAEVPADLAKKAKAVLEKSCHSCHGENGTVEGGFGYVMDRQQLVSRKRVLPGDPSKSKLFHRVESGDMPPDGKALAKDDVAILKKWIAAGAPDFNPAVAKRTFIFTEEVIALMRADIKKRDEADRKFTRYITLTHLYNAGRPEDELQGYRNGVAKLVNSLSWARKVVVPTPIDPARTVLRIDLRDYKWSTKIWDSIAGSDPYGLVHPDSKTAQNFYEEAGCVLPHVRGDWLVAAASRPPLYHEILQLPATEKELETLLRVDADDNIRTHQVARAGFNGSAVSRNNRMIERHESSYGYYWKSYDFGKNVDRQNLFAYPLGPGAAKNHYKHDGGELIFNLPNGLQAYMLVNGEGRRIAKGPTEIVSDPKRPDRAVENGVSCMSCHVKGLLPKDDQIRAHAEKNPDSFSDKELEAVRAMYLPKDRFQALVKEDSDRFRKAVEQTGGHVGTTEPIVALALLFEAELDLALAAAELNVEPADLEKLLKRSPELARTLGNLQTPGGTVQREVFGKTFPDAAREWKLGTLAAKATAADIGKDPKTHSDPADAGTVVITPPVMTEDRVVKRLPDVYSEVVVGGGGRYLIFHLSKLKKLAVFDFNEARVTKYIPLTEDNVTFTAGLDCVIIGLKKANKLERWSLTTFEREKSVWPPFKEDVTGVVMGYASKGPVVVNGFFVDPVTFRLLRVTDPKGNERPLGSALGRFPSGDGTVFGAWKSNQSPVETATFVLEGGIVTRHEGGELMHAIPGPDGRFVYTAKGVVSRTLNRADKDDATFGYCLPALRGDYFLSLTSAQAGKGGSMTVYMHGVKHPVGKVENAEHGLAFDGWDRGADGPWKRIFYVPDANVIAVLPNSNDQVVLHKFDADAALEKSGADYLIVTSRPPTEVKAGAVFTYPVKVKSRDKKVTYQLDSGPRGMTVSGAGVAEWTVPANAVGTQDVILTVRTESGQEVFHTFTVKVVK